MAALKRRILIVEDDNDIRDILVELLLDSGYDVTSARNGQVALEILSDDKEFDLILLDLMMPVIDGFTFREMQLADSTIAEIPVIIMSADGQINEKKGRAQCVDYLRKPLDIEPLLAIVAKRIGA